MIFSISSVGEGRQLWANLSSCGLRLISCNQGGGFVATGPRLSSPSK